MTSSLFPPEPENEGTDTERELAALERKLSALIDHAIALRADNDALRQELASAQIRNRALSERVEEARERLDTLLARLPQGGLVASAAEGARS